MLLGIAAAWLIAARSFGPVSALPSTATRRYRRIPVASLPGTGTFVWWEKQIDPALVFGIPMGGWRMPDGRFGEGTQLEPDIKVHNDPLVLAAGRDQQLEAAVKELLKTAALTQATP